MNVRSRRSPVRSLALLALLSSSGCAFFGQPEPQRWTPGSYDFVAPLEGSPITGTIEIESAGPTAVTTSLGPCSPQLSQNYRPWSRSRTFLCAGDHQVVVSVGTRVGPPINGTISNWRTVTRYETVERCVRYESVEETGARICAQWIQEQRAVTERVGGSARISLVEAEDSAGRR